MYSKQVVVHVLWGSEHRLGASCVLPSHPAETQAPHRFGPFSSDPGLSLKILMLCFSGFSGFQPGNSSGGRKLYPVYQQTRQDYSLVILRQSWEELPGILCRGEISEADFHPDVLRKGIKSCLFT